MKSLHKICLYAFLTAVFVYLFMYVQLQQTEVTVPGWSYNTTRDTSQYIASNNITAHILPEHFCSDSNTFLLVVVCSAPQNFEARHAIRETWGTKRDNVSVFFLLGETLNVSVQYDIMLESEKHGDIIQEHFIDSYNNLTLKSVVMLKLVTGHCANTTKYLFKVDDDMYVNMPLIVDTLTRNDIYSGNSSSNGTNTNGKGLLMGSLICRARPIKDASSKWYSPRYMYSDRIYPNYLSGTGYVMSVDVAERLYATAMRTPIFHLEDVYLTGICAKKAGIRSRNNPRFTYHRLSYDPCLLTKLFTAHRFSPADILRTHADLTDRNLQRECSLQKRVFSVNHWIMNNVIKANRTLRSKKSSKKCE